MNLFDLAIALILGFCLIRGIFTGLIREFFSLSGVFAGFYAASAHYIEVAKSLSHWIPSTLKADILSFLSIFFGCLIVITILGRIVKSLIKIDLLSGVDHTVGAIFGAIKGILIVSVLLLTLTAFLPEDAPFIKNSLLSSHFTFLSARMDRIVSKNMRHEFSTKIEAYKNAWKNKK